MFCYLCFIHSILSNTFLCQDSFFKPISVWYFGLFVMFCCDDIIYIYSCLHIPARLHSWSGPLCWNLSATPYGSFSRTYKTQLIHLCTLAASISEQILHNHSVKWSKSSDILLILLIFMVCPWQEENHCGWSSTWVRPILGESSWSCPQPRCPTAGSHFSPNPARLISFYVAHFVQGCFSHHNEDIETKTLRRNMFTGHSMSPLVNYLLKSCPLNFGLSDFSFMSPRISL